ncbi:MAG: hypothetical protein ACTSYD_07650 [Candidatus Heimdallarchaeaceae archaeon]
MLTKVEVNCQDIIEHILAGGLLGCFWDGHNNSYQVRRFEGNTYKNEKISKEMLNSTAQFFAKLWQIAKFSSEIVY